MKCGYKVGDFVRVVALDLDAHVHESGVKVGDIIPVIPVNDLSTITQYGVGGVEVDYVNNYPGEFAEFCLPKYFECVDQTGLRFTGTYSDRSKSAVLTWCREDGHNENGSIEHKILDFLRLFRNGDLSGLRSLRVPVAGEYVISRSMPEPLGAYRPNLEDRKVDKVRVELVDFGFPNALWEVAKVMTWAQEAKGYKDHDWKNLPNAKYGFPAAASRHRMKHNFAVAFGLPLNEDGVTDEGYTDEESKFFHKAHEAFNILCELELLVTGKITTKA